MKLKEFEKLKSNQSGIVLVMALIISGLMIGGAITLTTVLAREVKVSLNASNAIIAHYAAEAGIEFGLSRIKRARNQFNYTDFTNIEIGNGDGTYTLLPSVYNIDFQVLESNTSSLPFIVYDITTSTPENVDILAPDGNLNSINWGNPDYYVIDWEIYNCYDEHANDRLQITVESFASNFSTPQTYTDLAVCDCTIGSDQCNNTLTTYGDISPNRFYRYTFRALDSEIAQLEFTVYDDMGEPIPILSEAEIIVDGKYRSSEYRLSARISTVEQISDVFSYVIFSEQDLIKN